MPLDTITRIWIGTDANDTMDDNGRTAGSTLIQGSGGNDAIRGFGEADLIIGGAGNDQLSGGQGGDTFAFKFAVTEAVIIPAWTERTEREVEVTGTREVITEHRDVFTWSMTGIKTPNQQADWKAWDGYEKAVSNFFNGSEATPGSMAHYEAQGYVFDTNVLASKAAWNGPVTSYNDAGSDRSIVFLGPPDSGSKKIANTWGNDGKNHDLMDNLQASVALGKSGQAAFKVVNGDAVTGVHEYTTTETVPYSYMETVVEYIEHPEVLVSPESVQGGDGSDTILDFSLGQDKLFLATADADTQLTKDKFIADFTVTKSSDAHGVVVATNDGSWSVDIRIDGLASSDPFLSVTGASYASLSGDALEAVVWDHMVNQSPTYANAAWSSHMDGWIG